ncbi:MAG: site-specific integrase, partial [Sphingobacterium sp.]
MSKQSFINFLKFEKRYSVHTINAYSLEIDAYHAFLETQNLELLEVTFRDVRVYLAQLKEAGRQATSMNRSISSLRSYYKFLLREGLVDTNPMRLVHALKTPKKLPVVIEQDKMIALLEQGHAQQNDFEQTRDFVVLELLFGTGIRLSELLNIQERDIDTYNQRVLVLGKRNKERLIPIHKTLMEEIKRYLKLKYTQEFKNNSAYLIVTKVGKQAY